jgi:dTDP-4-amino-4,6-dideoxygalactose transaminase
MKKYSAFRDTVYENFKNNNVFVRRYFYPLISQFPAYRTLESAHAANLPVAEEITKKILCLPIYPGLETDTIDAIIQILVRMQPQLADHFAFAEQA